jgi:hypothetical protein
MPDQVQLVKDLRARNKFLLKSGYVDTTSERGIAVILVDGIDQLAMVYNDTTGSEKLTERHNAIQGLPIKYTNAPKFVLLADKSGKESVANRQEEQEDEFADIYKSMGVHDLTAKELIYIKRFEQMGFWRKRFTVEEQKAEEKKM